MFKNWPIFIIRSKKRLKFSTLIRYRLNFIRINNNKQVVYDPNITKIYCINHNKLVWLNII